MSKQPFFASRFDFKGFESGVETPGFFEPCLRHPEITRCARKATLKGEIQLCQHPLSLAWDLQSVDPTNSALVLKEAVCTAMDNPIGANGTMVAKQTQTA